MKLKLVVGIRKLKIKEREKILYLHESILGLGELKSLIFLKRIQLVIQKKIGSPNRSLRLVASRGNAPPLWAEKPEFAGLTRVTQTFA